MEKNESGEGKKAIAKANSLQYRERFQFVLYVKNASKKAEGERAEQIVCQRYFNIVGFNYRSLESVELLHAMSDAARMIQDCLASKSRVFMWHNEDLPIQMTGFDGGEKEFFSYPEGVPDNKFLDKERPEPYSVTFRLALLADEKPVYEYMWDGSAYPSYVRNNVDLSNSDEQFRGTLPQNMHFSMTLAYHMNSGRGNLVNEIIRLLCNTMSNEKGKDKREYTREFYYPSEECGDCFSTSVWAMNQKKIKEWERATEKKTSEYFSRWSPSAREIERINRL